MAKEIEPNDDWLKRDQGRIPTKGTAAAERASCGLGILSDDEALALIGFFPRVEKSAERRTEAAGSA
jgi:hypothetical protein